jgi:hypothetical protein
MSCARQAGQIDERLDELENDAASANALLEQSNAAITA